MPEDETLSAVLEKAKKLVTPSREEKEKLDRTAKKVSNLLERFFAEAKGAVVPEIAEGGSYAKGTWLRGSGDIDYYLLYPISYPRQKLETEAIELSRRAVKGYEIKMRFAEHPYVECYVDNIRVNIVPCYKVARGEWQSAADRSPFHTDYICSKFDDYLRGETRLLKKYVKYLDLYGAEVKTQGLSGYVCEVLTLQFGSFASALENMANLKERQVISVEEYDHDVVESFQSRLIILDPIDTTRNLGTAISARNVSKLILECRSFLSRPSLRYFSEEGRKAEKKNVPARKALLERTLIVSFRTKERSVDILWGQLGKSLNAIVQLLDFYDFEVLRSKASSNEFDHSALIVLLKEREISKFKVRVGPDMFRGSDVDRFLEKNKDRAALSWIDFEGKVNFLFERKDSLTDARSVVTRVLSDRNSVRSIGLAKEIAKELAAKFTIQDGLSVLKNKEKTRAWLADDVENIVSKEIANQ